jgi:nucleoside transporter
MAGDPAPTLLRARLGAYMFVILAVNGAWMSALAQYLKDLGFGELQISWILSAGAIANLVSPLAAGQAVDRWFSSERFLVVANLGTATFLFGAFLETRFGPLLALMLGAQICFAATIPLSVSLAYRHLENPARQFPQVRLWGTVGWIAGAWGLTGWLHLSGRGLRDSLAIAAILAALSAACALLLPRTPPRRDAARRFAVGQALEMLRDPSFAFFVALMFLLQIGTTFYFTRSPIFLHHVGVSRPNLPLVISIGQVIEVGVILAMGRLHPRVGMKGMIALGILSWAARYGLFALGAPAWLMIASMSLHGPCFAFGRIAPTMYVEQVAPADARASAQSLLSLIMDGAALLLGNLLAGLAARRLREDWTTYWLLPAVATAVLFIAFLAAFRPRHAPRPA